MGTAHKSRFIYEFLIPEPVNDPYVRYADLSAIQNFRKSFPHYGVMVSTAKVLSTLDRSSILAAQS